MNCLECETLILDDGDDPDSAAAAISAHVTDCGKCREFFASQRALRELLCQRLATIRLSAEFQRRLQGRIRRDESLGRLRRAIAFTEFASVPLLVVAVFLISAGLMRLPWLDPTLYIPAIAASIVLVIVRDVVSGENAAG